MFTVFLVLLKQSILLNSSYPTLEIPAIKSFSKIRDSSFVMQISSLRTRRRRWVSRNHQTFLQCQPRHGLTSIVHVEYRPNWLLPTIWTQLITSIYMSPLTRLTNWVSAAFVLSQRSRVISSSWHYLNPIYEFFDHLFNNLRSFWKILNELNKPEIFVFDWL